MAEWNGLGRYPEDADVNDRPEEGTLLAYVDGSYQDALKKYGFGCIFILPDGRIYTEYGNGDNPDSLKQRNVSGEMLGAMYAVRFALNSGFTVIETAKLGVANGNGIPKVKSLSDFEAADGVEA